VTTVMCACFLCVGLVSRVVGLGASACDMRCTCEHVGGDNDVHVCSGSPACAHGRGEGHECVERVARMEVDGDDDLVH
jgi:hypothetical protein